MGPTVYSNDGRVLILSPNKTDAFTTTNRAALSKFGENWVLNINEAKVSDSGIYECQINTEPKKSKAYELLVVGKYKQIKTLC